MLITCDSFFSLQILVVMASGPWKNDSDSKMYRARVLMSLKDRGVEVYSVGAGPDTSANQMSDISSGRSYWFLASSYDDLSNVRPRIIQSIKGSKYIHNSQFIILLSEPFYPGSKHFWPGCIKHLK